MLIKKNPASKYRPWDVYIVTAISGGIKFTLTGLTRSGVRDAAYKKLEMKTCKNNWRQNCENTV